MSREVKELNDRKIAEIAFKVRTRLEGQFGRERIRKFISKDFQIAQALVHETWFAVREKIEQDVV